MAEPGFIFKHFIVYQDRCAMKVGTDGLLLGSYVQPQDHAVRILDIGTGTGLLAMMLAQKSKAAIDAVDIDEDAAIQAAENFRNSAWSSRLHAHHVALQDYDPGYKYDLIISNPPYFEDFESIARASDKGRQLARSQSGLSYGELLSHAARLLIPGGRIYIIIPATAIAKLESMATDNGLFLTERLTIKSRRDSAAIRYILCFSNIIFPLKEAELLIYEKAGYSLDYIMLTRDFYARDMLAKHYAGSG